MAAGLKQRIASFDWLRGLAVLFMVQCHSVMFLLDPSLKGSTLYRTLLKLDGLVAPAFIFSAGFSLALVLVRAAGSTEGRAGRLLKTSRRLVEVLGVASLVNWCWFPVFREPKWFLRIDILHCIGLSLLLALPLLTVLARRPMVLRWVTLSLAVGVFALTPWAQNLTGPAALFLNSSAGAQFPLLPWAGYVYLGASAGATAAQGELRPLVRWLAVLGALGFVLWQSLGWDHPQRVVWITGLVLLLLLLEHRIAGLGDRAPFRALTTFGQSSLAAYFFHELILFYGHWWAFALGVLLASRLPSRAAAAVLLLSPLVAYQAIGRVRGIAMADFFRDRADWAVYWPLLALLLCATYALVTVTDALYRRLERDWNQRVAQSRTR